MARAGVETQWEGRFICGQSLWIDCNINQNKLKTCCSLTRLPWSDLLFVDCENVCVAWKMCIYSFFSFTPPPPHLLGLGWSHLFTLSLMFLLRQKSRAVGRRCCKNCGNFGRKSGLANLLLHSRDCDMLSSSHWSSVWRRGHCWNPVEFSSGFGVWNKQTPFQFSTWV